MKKTVIMCDYVSRLDAGVYSETCGEDISAYPGYILRVPTHKGSYDNYDVIIEDWDMDRTKKADLCPEHKITVLEDVIALLKEKENSHG